MRAPSVAPSGLLAATSLAVLCLLGGAPLAAAQHEHGATASVVVSHDSNANGFEFVGNVAHFGILDVGDDDVPDYHQQNHVRVTLNGAVLLETTPDSGHDYDGVNLFDVVFPAAGAYTVEDLDEGGHVLAQFNGTVVQPQPGDEAPAAVALSAPETVSPAQPATYTFSLRSSTNAILNHTDAWFEAFDANGLLLRTKTHTHDTEQQVRYAYLGHASSFTVTVTAFVAFPGPGATLVKPVTSEAHVSVIPGTPAPPSVPNAPAVPDAPNTNAVVKGDGAGPYELIGTYDPWTTVGPTTQMRLTALAMDPATRHPVPHVNFAATLTGRSSGLAVFSSQTLHEYDGIWEFATVAPVGEYVLSVDATRGNWTSHMDLPYAVIPPAVAVLPGQGTIPLSTAQPQETVDVTGLTEAKAGIPFTLGISIHDAAGQPLQHSEVDVQVLDHDRIPVLATKLHTHETGTFSMQGTLPAGDYSLRLLPFSLEPRPAFDFVSGSCSAPSPALCPLGELPFTVGDGPGIPAALGTVCGGGPCDGIPHSAPLPVLPFVLVALVVAAHLRRK